MFQLRLNGVSSSFKRVSRVFERSLKGVLGKWCFREFERSFKEVSRVFKGSLREISRMFNKVLRVFQLRLRGV